MSWAFSEEGEEVVEVVAHAAIEKINAARINRILILIFIVVPPCITFGDVVLAHLARK
jgi:hypothetical protein